MYKKISYYVLLSIVTMMLASCGSVKNVAYFQNSDYIDPVLRHSSMMHTSCPRTF